MEARRERLKNKIIALIDSGVQSNWRKAAFYSDPQVSEITAQLYERWESSGRAGMPVDYATLEELEVLARKAEEYAFLDEETARAITFSRMSGEPPSRGGSLAGFLKALLRRGGKRG